MIYDSVESWLNEKFIEAKRMVKDYHRGTILWKNHEIYLVNITKGRDAYFKETGTSPVLDATHTWDSEYGSVETLDGKHFIFLNDILVSNWVESDVLATLIHELLHILYPSRNEKEVKAEEKVICERYGIVAEWSLE